MFANFQSASLLTNSSTQAAWINHLFLNLEKKLIHPFRKHAAKSSYNILTSKSLKGNQTRVSQVFIPKSSKLRNNYMSLLFSSLSSAKRLFELDLLENVNPKFSFIDGLSNKKLGLNLRMSFSEPIRKKNDMNQFSSFGFFSSKCSFHSSLGRAQTLASFQIVSVRGFKSRTERNLGALESEANQDPSNPEKQAAFYQELLTAGYYPLIISRFENYDLGVNLDCLQAYVLALIKSNQSDKVAAKFLEAIQTKTSLRGLKLPNGVTSQDIVRAIDEARPFENNNKLQNEVGNKARPMHVIVEESSSAVMWKTIRSVGSGLAFMFLTLTFVSLLLENSGITKSPTKTTPEFEPDLSNSVTFEDVQGVDEAKNELIEMVEFLKDPSRFDQIGGKLPKGILLTGPPGTGKTLLARAVAGEAGVPFFFMSGSEFDEMYVGVGARRVRELFAAARKKAPSIVFIDEIDAVGARRNPKDQAYMKQTLNQLLVDLDGFSPSEGVIFIGATNFPQLLDKALVRPGRFDRHIEVSLPDVRGRIQVLKLHSKSIPLADNVDLEIVARGTPGFSGADLANLVNLAAIQASRKRSSKVQPEHFEFAKDRILMGAERKSMVVSDKSKRITAYHEGGHALVAFHTPCAMPLHKATIMPRGRSLGMTMQLPEMDKDNYSKCEYKAMLDVAMGGRVAEEILLGDEHVTSGAQNDFQQATNIARSMVTQLGMCPTLGRVDYDSQYEKLSSDTKLEIDAQIRKLLDDSYSRASTLLRSKRKELDLLASALIEWETLSVSQIEEVIHGKKPTFN